MTIIPSTKPLAEWTVPEKCNYLAKEIMGWPGGYEQDQYGFWGALKTPKTYHQWEPYSSWDNGREVEEKVMEEEILFARYCDNLFYGVLCPIDAIRNEVETMVVATAISADLPTRMDAVIAAHQSLPTP